MHKLFPPCIFGPWHTWSLTQPTLLGFIPASGNGHQFFWHYTERQRFVPTCQAQQTSPHVTELLPWFLFVLAEPQPLLELCCQMDFGGTFESPTPNTNSQGRVVTGLETTAQSSCSGIGPASLLGNWKHQQLFSFF